MSDLRKLIEAVEVGEFLLDAMPSPYETTAYRAFGGSLDAAKALHEALLPGWEWHSMSRNGVSLRGAWVENPGDAEASGYEWQDERIKGQPARAWLLAILKAYEARS